MDEIFYLIFWAFFIYLGSIPTKILFKISDEKTLNIFVATVLSVFGVTALAVLVGFLSGNERIALLLWLIGHVVAWCSLVGYALHRRMISQ